MNLKDVKSISLGNKKRMRVGRGTGSGKGGTSGKGHKGRNARAGVGGFIGYEGGQTPLFRRLPKRGFSNANHEIKYAVINVGDLEGLEPGSEVTAEGLLKARKIGSLKAGLKVLGGGELKTALKVHARKFSATAAEKIRQAGGEVKEL
jgi:large subunit ribosomal protein L15